MKFILIVIGSGIHNALTPLPGVTPGKLFITNISILTNMFTMQSVAVVYANHTIPISGILVKHIE